MSEPWPISYADVSAARDRIKTVLPATPLRRYPGLERWLDRDIECWVKHEDHQPTGAFKVRSNLNAVGSLSDEERNRGLVGATRGNHGQGLAWAGRRLGAPVTICVPEGNSPAKNQAMVDLGAELIIAGKDYDASVLVATELVESRGMTMIHSTNNRAILAGAATITDEILDEQRDLDAMVVAVGGGSQAAGALTVARERAPSMAIHGVQAAGASAAHDGYQAKAKKTTESAVTFADGLATRSCYDMTFPILRDGLAGFVLATEAELAEAVRRLVSEAQSLAEGAGAASLAGLFKLRDKLAGKRVAIILSGGNIDSDVLTKILTRAI